MRRRIDLKDLLVFETTLATQAPAPSFSQAERMALRQLAEDAPAPFVVAIDIRRARMQKIRPLSLAGDAAAGAAAEAVPAVEALEAAPVLPGFDVEVEAEPVTAAGRIALWQRKLLNLTTSNRLLNLPEGGKVVRLLCPDPGSLEDRLAAGRKVRIVAMPDLAAGGRDEQLFEAQTHEALRADVARAALDRGEVLSLADKETLDATLVDLYRKARSDMAEGGANTLFLALGFLKWKKAASDPRSFRAPLILLPVRLERKSALSGVVMVQHEDEPRFNLTLLELLRQDFEFTIPGLDGPLPTDERGVDLAGIWTTVRRAVRDLPGFEVTEELVLGTFSFAKYLMWKDLVDRADRLKESPTVRHLIERDGSSFPVQEGFPRPEQLDQSVDPAELFIPLPADSSQIAAVVASARGHDFVLDGPPGTGKSQTIANMIAHNLALGRRVLFVAEKMAALNVVQRRLAEKGLGEFCLELHSAKATKTEVLKQLDRAWTTRETMNAGDWAREAAEARRLRDQLNGLVALLHRRAANGLTVHGAIGRVVRDWTETSPRLAFAPGREHGEADLARLRDIARRLGLAWDDVDGLAGVLDGIGHAEWTNGWQDAIVAAAAAVPPALDAVQAARDGLLAATRLPLTAEEPAQLVHLRRLVELALQAHGRDLRFAFAPDVADRVAVARTAIGLVERYRRDEAALSARYAPEAARRIGLAAIRTAWQEAEAKMWPFAGFARKRVARDLAQQGGASGPVDVLADLPHLDAMAAGLRDLDGLAPRLAGIPGWAGLATDGAAVETILALAESLRAEVAAAATGPDHLAVLRGALSTLVVDANDMLAPAGAIATAPGPAGRGRRSVRAPWRSASTAWPNRPPPAAISRRYGGRAQAVLGHAPRLKAWTDWRRVRDEAMLARARAAGRRPGGRRAGAARRRSRPSRPAMPAGSPAPGSMPSRCCRALPPRSIWTASRRSAGSTAGCPSWPCATSGARICGLIPAKDERRPRRRLCGPEAPAAAAAPAQADPPAGGRDGRKLHPAGAVHADEPAVDRAVSAARPGAVRPGDLRRGVADRALGRRRRHRARRAGRDRRRPAADAADQLLHPIGHRDRRSDADTEEDMESILDECLAAGVPMHSLSWHYRSRHESLIAFSNHRYYENAGHLPGAGHPRQRGGVAPGGGCLCPRQGPDQPDRGAGDGRRGRAPPADPAFIAAGHTLGIITLNADQQRLVEDLLDKARRAAPRDRSAFRGGPHRAGGGEEPGDGAGRRARPDHARHRLRPDRARGKAMSMSFGALNSQGGWRRLNVAVTRARREMLVFTSFDPGMIDLNRTSARAVRDLKHFVEFAERGPTALAEAVHGSVGGPKSPFEQAVARELARRGWTVVPQIGVSRFRIDLGIVHPDRPGDYLAGVECDGVAYHSAATARDRDKVRAAILEGLGWTLIRIWSTDWWVDKAGAADRLHKALEAKLAASRARIEAEKAAPPPAVPIDAEPAPAADAAPDSAAPPAPGSPSGDGESMPPEDAPVRVALQAPAGGAVTIPGYRITDFAPHQARIDPDAFYDAAYDEMLATLVGHVLDGEAPIAETLLVQRIARAHGFQRAGRLIRERVMAVVARRYLAAPDGTAGLFVWHDRDAPARWQGFRPPATPDDIRQIEEIALAEIRAARPAATTEDPAVEIARRIRHPPGQRAGAAADRSGAGPGAAIAPGAAFAVTPAATRSRSSNGSSGSCGAGPPRRAAPPPATRHAPAPGRSARRSPPSRARACRSG